jgi:DNA-directed RNA polymerase subunit RPC12/RpoP
MKATSSKLALLLTALFLFWAGAQIRGQASPDKDSQRYSEPLRGKPANPKDFVLMGPDAKTLVRYEPEGLHIVLPAGFKGDRPITGVASTFGLGGDFEITVNFEILQEPDNTKTGAASSGLILGITLKNEKRYMTNIARKLNNNGPLLVTWMAAPLGPKGEDKTKSKSFKAQAKQGRLRLARVGKMISYSFADGPDKELVQVNEMELADDDVKQFRLAASTGGDQAALDVRFTDLQIRAERLLKPVPAPPVPPPASSPLPKPKLNDQLNYPLHIGYEQLPGLKLFGSAVDKMASANPRGLRFNIPALRADIGPIGVETLQRLQGDFAVTLDYELLQEPNPPPQNGAGVVLHIRFAAPKVVAATVTRTHKPTADLFGSNIFYRGEDGKEQLKGLNYVRALEKRGTLQLSRVGAKLIYAAADGAQPFREIKTMDVPTDDVILVQGQLYTGWVHGFSLDVRLTNLRVAAENLPDKAKLPVTFPSEKPHSEENTPEHGWLALVLFAGLIIMICTFVGIWLITRRRPARKVDVTEPALTNNKASAPAKVSGQKSDRFKTGTGPLNSKEPAPALKQSLSLQCSGCGKRLKVRAELAGRKIKCPQCGLAVRAE